MGLANKKALKVLLFTKRKETSTLIPTQKNIPQNKKPQRHAILTQKRETVFFWGTNNC